MPSLVAPIFLPFPPTRFILEPPVVGTEKPLFLLRALPQKKSDFAVLIADEFNLELVEWCHSARELPGTYAVPRTPLRGLPSNLPHHRTANHPYFIAGGKALKRGLYDTAGKAGAFGVVHPHIHIHRAILCRMC